MLLDLMETYGNGFQWVTADYTQDDIDAALSTAQRELMEETTVSSDFEVIVDFVLTANLGTFYLTDIPNTYRHLRLIMELRSTRSADGTEEAYVVFNSDDASANYDNAYHVVNLGNGVHSQGVTAGQNKGRVSNAATTSVSAVARHGTIEALIPDYASTDRAKQLSYKVWKPTMYAASLLTEGFIVWQTEDDPISQIAISPTSGANWLAGSRFTLYGLKGQAPPV